MKYNFSEKDISFPPWYDPASERIILTPSAFAQEHLLYVQETGRLKLIEARHKTSRNKLPSYLLVSVISGAGTLEYEGQSYPVGEGQGFLIDCRNPHRYYSSISEPWELRWVHFNGKNAEQYYSIFKSRGGPVIRLLHKNATDRLLSELTLINRRQSLDTELQNSSILTQLLTLLLVRDIGGVSDIMKEIRLYIREHYMEKITLDVLADKFLISKYHLSREFKKCFGETIVQYITALRANHAKHLLRFTQMGMNDISEACGYCDQNYFTRRFSKTEGCTPSEYRKLWQTRTKRPDGN